MPIGMKTVKPKQESSSADQLKEQQSTMETDDLTDVDTGANKNPAIKIIPVVIAVLVIVALCVFAFMKSNSSSKQDTSDTNSVSAINSTEHNDNDDNNVSQSASTNPYYDADGNVINRDAINPGINSVVEDGNPYEETTPKVYSSDDYIKDLNGVDIPAVYNVKEKSYVYDYADYEMRRAIIDDGMEMYWLELTYNDKKYRTQIPYLRFVTLKDKGICKVQVEVLTLEGGEKVISYMQVVDDDAGY